jgi:type I restriction enzyme M protein
MSLSQLINRITDILRRDDGINGAMHYTEQISWILFLKFLNDYEDEKSTEAELEGKKYTYAIDEKHRWHVWACPQLDNGKPDLKNALTGKDLKQYVDNELFPYLKSFKDTTQDPTSIKYKIGEIFSFLDNRIHSGHTLREALDIVDQFNFQSKDDLFELSEVYESLLRGMGSDGGNAGEFYTPRPVIRTMVEALKPRVGQTVYDGATGSGGFLIQAYEYMRNQKGIKTKDWNFLQEKTFYGNEKTPLAYVMGVMNMILHGIESPNVYHRNTLTVDIRTLQESDRYDVILANPPFGGKEKAQMQQNFPIKTNATEMLFIQHFMKSLKIGGKVAIVVPEGVLFQSAAAFSAIKKELLEGFNLHTILSLPAGVFLPYSAVKTNIIFFERTGSTQDIWYYEVNLPEKLTKNKPIENGHFEEFLDLFEKRVDSENSWTVNITDIKNYDLSAKNPNKDETVEHLPPVEIINQIRENDVECEKLLNEISKLLN